MKDITIDINAGNGELARVAAALAREQVTLRAGAAVCTGPRFVARFIPSSLDAARHALDRAGVAFEESEIIAVRLEARPGELVELVGKLAAGGVGLRALYLTAATGRQLEIAVAPTNIARAVRALRA
ncbi:MAG TPA: hypothetical protein VM032_05950 [Vicinamibacterales bacterium]|nr:hypothetical protein [Vicinamibacterales bacterium]